MPPLLRTERGEVTDHHRRFYAKRLRARSTRVIQRAQVPLRVGVPDAPRKEEQFSTRLDVLGPLLEMHHPVVPDGSRANLLAAFDKRCNFYSDKRVDKTLVQASRGLLDRIAPSAWDPLEWTPELFHEWNSQFDDAKRQKHLKLLPTLSEITSKQFSDKQIFVKVEALLKRHDASWAPRVINQSSDAHNALLGPVMWRCTKRMFASFEHEPGTEGVRYLGAYSQTPEALVARIQRGGNSESRYVESDFSSNDMTQVRDVHLLEIEWLTRFGAPRWLTGLMLHANSYGVSSRKHSVAGRVKNQLPTGAQSTTFRNSMWNASINHAFSVKHKARGDCLILGDDMLMRFDNPFSSKSKNLRREYEHICLLACMRAEVSVRRHLSECTFLSKQFIMVDTGFVMAPKLGKALARFNARASSNEAVSDRSYLAGKALSYAYEFLFVPTVSALFLERYIVLSDGVREVSFDALGWNTRGEFLRRGLPGVFETIRNVGVVATPDDCTRFYHWKYNLTHTDLIELVTLVVFGEDDVDDSGAGRLPEDFL